MSLGIPFGIFLAVIGAIFLFTTNYKKVGKIILGVGASITVITFLLIILIVNSNM